MQSSSIDGETCFGLKIVAHFFKNFFARVASHLSDKLPSGFNLFHTDSQMFQQWHRESYLNTFGFHSEGKQPLMSRKLLTSLGTLS